MKQLAALAGTIVLAAVAAGAHTQNAAGGSEAVIIQHERSLYDAVAKGDKAGFQSLVAPDGVWTTPAGFVPNKMIVDGLGAYELPAWGIENPHVVWSGDNAALLLYARTGGGSYAHQPLPPVMLASTLWVKRDGRWMAVHHQESGLQQ